MYNKTSLLISTVLKNMMVALSLERKNLFDLFLFMQNLFIIVQNVFWIAHLTFSTSHDG